MGKTFSDRKIGAECAGGNGLRRSLLVAAITRTSTEIEALPSDPLRTSLFLTSRSNATWVSAGSSPTSSRKSVAAIGEFEAGLRRRCRAPVKAPFSWPNSSEYD